MLKNLTNKTWWKYKWCRIFHNKVMFGGGNYWICGTCQLKHPTPWAINKNTIV